MVRLDRQVEQSVTADTGTQVLSHIPPALTVGIWHSIAEMVHLQVPELITAGTVPGTVPTVVLGSPYSTLLDETIRLMRRGKW